MALRQHPLVRPVLATFVVAFLGGPWLHNLDHAADHEHGADGFSIRWLEAAGRQHQRDLEDHDRAHREGRSHAHGPPTPLHAGAPHDRDAASLQTSLQASWQQWSPIHGQGAASHFGAGTVAVPVFLLAPAAGEAVAPALRSPPAQPDSHFSFAVAQPRGPPDSGGLRPSGFV